MKGFQRLFSMRSIMEFVKGILKIVVIEVLSALKLLYPYFGQLDHMVGLPIPLLMGEMKTLVVRLMVGILVVLLVIAVIDLLYQRYEHYKRMRMTKQELKDEYKQTEGDPHVKARLRQLRTEKARQRMIQAVPRADVVITNPTHYSIALEYKPETMDAPVCIAKGISIMSPCASAKSPKNIISFSLKTRLWPGCFMTPWISTKPSRRSISRPSPKSFPTFSSCAASPLTSLSSPAAS